jgi:hypothetical protein
MNRLNCLTFLRNVHAASQNGKVSNLEGFARAAGIPENYTTIVRRLKIVTRVPGTFTYVWSARVPDSVMVTRIIEAMADYNRGERVFRTRVSPNTPDLTAGSQLPPSTPTTNVTRTSLSSAIAELHALCAVNKISVNVLTTEEGVKKVLAVKNLLKEVQ